MPIQILINLLIGLIWVFFQDNWSFLTFLTGYLFGLLVLFILRRFLKGKFYPITVIAVFRLIFVFIEEIVISSVDVIRTVIAPKIDVTPGFFLLETDLETDWEITLLAMLITATPGSVVTEISEDGKRFYVHGLDLPGSKEGVFRSQKKFEEAIKRVTRS